MELLDNLSSAEILGLTIIGEGRGEPIEGQVAIGSVIRNRLHSGLYKTYNEACLAREQFSCWNNNDSNYPFLTDLAQKLINGQIILDPYLKQCMLVANGIVNWEILDNTGSALNYITSKLFNSDSKPSWATGIKSFKQIGSQVFFTA